MCGPRRGGKALANGRASSGLPSSHPPAAHAHSCPSDLDSPHLFICPAIQLSYVLPSVHPDPPFSIFPHSYLPVFPEPVCLLLFTSPTEIHPISWTSGLCIQWNYPSTSLTVGEIHAGPRATEMSGGFPPSVKTSPLSGKWPLGGEALCSL